MMVLSTVKVVQGAPVFFQCFKNLTSCYMGSKLTSWANDLANKQPHLPHWNALSVIDGFLQLCSCL